LHLKRLDLLRRRGPGPAQHLQRVFIISVYIAYKTLYNSRSASPPWTRAGSTSSTWPTPSRPAAGRCLSARTPGLSLFLSLSRPPSHSLTHSLTLHLHLCMSVCLSLSLSFSLSLSLSLSLPPSLPLSVYLYLSPSLFLSLSLSPSLYLSLSLSVRTPDYSNLSFQSDRLSMTSCEVSPSNCSVKAALWFVIYALSLIYIYIYIYCQ
jgi:hypothetical protein